MNKYTYALMGVTMAGASMVNASLTPSYQFVGNGNWSLDAKGENASPVGIVRAEIPVGSTIEKAFLYSSKYSVGSPSSVNFDGVTIAAGDWQSLGTSSFLEAYRVDVTAQVMAKVGAGGGTFNFSLDEGDNSGTDGEALAVVYSNPSEKERTIAFLDGASDMNGDSAFFFFAEPLADPSAADFEALMSLGIGFGWQGNDQYSQVDVNGKRLTTSAGGQDDGIAQNGGLITIGGIGDDPANPADPTAFPPNDPRYDDELYTLTPFLKAGDTKIQIDTLNPSNDDNIFFWGINITAKGEVRPDVPEPGELLLLGVGAFGAAGYYLRRRKA